MCPLLYLVDIVIIAIVYFALEAGADAIPGDFRVGIIASTIAKCVLFFFVWFWLRLRGDTVATIGLAKPNSWKRSIAGGVMLAAALFTAVYLLERAGVRRDLSAFIRFKGDLEFTVYQVVGVMIGAGFGEEFLLRGFLFQRFAMLFGGSKPAWAIACVIQAALFGLLHIYQGPLGIVLTASIGLINGLVFLAAGRKLWVTIIAHVLYDTARIAAFYLYGPPPW
ncbi:MAG: CPBP family intramembrane glutamic endopeptidase [Chthoniobacterales bacterium]